MRPSVIMKGDIGCLPRSANAWVLDLFPNPYAFLFRTGCWGRGGNIALTPSLSIRAVLVRPEIWLFATPAFGVRCKIAMPGTVARSVWPRLLAWTKLVTNRWYGP